jgi:hypothetical protein
MFEFTQLKQDAHEFWDNQSTDAPHTLNAVEGPFALSEHEYVPELLQELVMSQRNEDKFIRVPMNAVNDIVNTFWEGPGSCARISDMIWDARIARAYGATFTESKGAYKLGYSEAEWKARTED